VEGSNEPDTGCCGGITYMTGDDIECVYDGSMDGNAYYITETVTGLLNLDPPSLTLTQIDTGLASPCHVGMRIMFTVPALRSCPGRDTYRVYIDGLCGGESSTNLTRSYYHSHGGGYMMGFGGEIAFESVSACSDPGSCSPQFRYVGSDPFTVDVDTRIEFTEGESITITPP
jgi:hypothetical protein